MDRDESARQVRAVRGFGDMPMIVLTAGQEKHLETYDQLRIKRDQARLLMSTRSEQRVVSASGQGIPWFAPYAVVDAVRDILAEVH